MLVTTRAAAMFRRAPWKSPGRAQYLGKASPDFVTWSNSIVSSSDDWFKSNSDVQLYPRTYASYLEGLGDDHKVSVHTAHNFDH